MLLSTFTASSCIYHPFNTPSLLLFILLFLLHSSGVCQAFSYLRTANPHTVLNSNFPARTSHVPDPPPPLGAPAYISLLQRTDPHRIDDNNRTPGSSKCPGRPARQADGGRARGSRSPAPGSARPRRSPPAPNGGAATAGRARTRSATATARSAVSARIRYDTRQPPALGPGGAPAGAAPPRDGAHGAAAAAAPPRAGARRPPRPGTSGLAAGAGGDGARRRYLRETDRASRRLGSAPRRSCRAVPAVPCAARAPPGSGTLTCPEIRPRPAPLRSLRRLGPALQDGGASGRDHGGRCVGGPGRCARPPRATSPAAPCLAPPRSGPAGPRPPAARPRRESSLW